MRPPRWICSSESRFHAWGDFLSGGYRCSSGPVASSRALSQSAWSESMPSPASVARSSKDFTPVRSTATGLAGVPPRIVPLRHNTLPSPMTINSTLPGFVFGASSTPTRASRREALLRTSSTRLLLAWVPTPRAKTLPPTARFWLVTDCRACGLPKSCRIAPRSSSSSQRMELSVPTALDTRKKGANRDHAIRPRGGFRAFMAGKAW